jgi:hypothetical protein
MLRQSKFNIPDFCSWIGAIFFWGVSFGEGRFDQQVRDKYKSRNTVTGFIVLVVFLIVISYNAGARFS